MRIPFCNSASRVSHEHLHLSVGFSSEYTIGDQFRPQLEVITFKVLESKMSDSLESSAYDPTVSLSRYFQLTCAWDWVLPKWEEKDVWCSKCKYRHSISGDSAWFYNWCNNKFLNFFIMMLSLAFWGTYLIVVKVFLRKKLIPWWKRVQVNVTDSGGWGHGGGRIRANLDWGLHVILSDLGVGSPCLRAFLVVICHAFYWVFMIVLFDGNEKQTEQPEISSFQFLKVACPSIGFQNLKHRKQ